MKISYRAGGDAVEFALRADRPEPPAEFVADLSARVSDSPANVHRGSRFAFGAAVAVLVIGTFLSFGGAAYAASGASEKPTSTASASAAADEYGKQPVAQVLTPPTARVAAATASKTADPKSGTLPFTGVGLGSTLLVSLLLVSLGLYLRRRESRE